MMKPLEGGKKRYLKPSFRKTPLIGMPHLLYEDGGKFKRLSVTANSTRLSLLPHIVNHSSMYVLHSEYLRGKAVSPDRWNLLGRTARALGLTKGNYFPLTNTVNSSEISSLRESEMGS